MTSHRKSFALSISVLCAGFAFGLSGCADTTKSTLLRSDLTISPPIGPVRLPTTKDGVSFQGNLSLQANQYTSRPLGAPDLNQTFLQPKSLDSSRIDGAIHLTQDQYVVSGEGSVFMGRSFRLFLGLDASTTQSFWAGAGFNAGKEWSFEVDAAMGNLIAKRREEWRIEKGVSGLTTSTRDTLIVRKDSSTFTRFDFIFAKRGGGPVFGYQALDLPITKAPNGDNYSRWLHTFTAGYTKPIGIGTLAGFLQATNTGESWSPSARIQYTFDLGGETSDEI